LKTASETRRILDLLETQHPDADTELHYQNAFQLLTATILSAQSTDQGVNMVTPALFARYPDAKALAIITPALLGPDFFKEAAAIVNTGGPPDVEKLKAVMAKHGLVPAMPAAASR